MSVGNNTTDEVLLRIRYAIRRLLRRGKYLLGHDPLALPLLLRLTPMGISKQITDYTDLVVEGFPRSGNTFTVSALQQAADHRIQISSHVHHPSQVKLAQIRGVPTVLIIRDPLDTLASYLTYGRHGHPATVIKEYCSYHRELLPYLDQLLLCEFTDNISDLSVTIARINERFSLEIPLFDQSPKNKAHVFNEISRFHALMHPKLNSAYVAPIPTQARREVIDHFRAELESPRYQVLMAEARSLYEYYFMKMTEQRAIFGTAIRVQTAARRDLGGDSGGRRAAKRALPAKRRTIGDSAKRNEIP